MTTSTKSRKAQATIIVLATYIFTHLSRICFTVRSSDGTTTYTTCFTNGHGSCTCPGNTEFHRECKHIKHLAPIAAAKLAEIEAKQAVKEAETIVTADANCDDSYEQWKRDNGLDGKLSRDEYCSVFGIYE